MKTSLWASFTFLALLLPLSGFPQPPIEPVWLVVPDRVIDTDVNSAHRIIVINGQSFVCGISYDYFEIYVSAFIAKYGTDGGLLGSAIVRSSWDGISTLSFFQMDEDRLIYCSEIWNGYESPIDAGIDCISTNPSHLWTRTFAGDYYDESNYFCGPATSVRDSLGNITIPFLLTYSDLFNGSSLKLKLLNENGHDYETIDLDGQSLSTRYYDMIGCPDGSIIIGRSNQIFKYSIQDEIVEWVQTVQSAGYYFHEMGSDGFVRAGKISDEEIAFVEKLDYGGSLIWHLEEDQFNIRGIDIIDDTILFAAQPWGQDANIILGAVSSSGELLWTWECFQGLSPQDMSVSPDGLVMVTGSHSSNDQTSVFLARFQLEGYDHVEPTNEIHERLTFQLLPVYPNPFNSSTSVHWSLDRPSLVSLTMYDLLGRPAQVVLVNQQFQAGEHTVSVRGEGLASGTYLLKLDAGLSGTQTQRITLVK